MSRKSGQSNGIVLPRQLQKELGLDLGGGIVRNGSRRGTFSGRKEKRRVERDQKKFARTKYGRAKDRDVVENTAHEQQRAVSSSEDGPKKKRSIAPAGKSQASGLEECETTNPVLRSILKKPPVQQHTENSSDSGSTTSRASSPGLVLDGSSTVFRDRAAQDDAEIAALEKKLGLRNRKLTKHFGDDGLNDLLVGLDSGGEKTKRKAENAVWLQNKRRKIGGEDEDDIEETVNAEERSGEDDEDTTAESGGPAVFSDDVEQGHMSGGSEQDSFGSFGFDTEEPPRPTRQRENPYVAPVMPSNRSTKYVPPSLRKAAHSDGGSIQRLRRQVQGLLNKLSETNLISIVNEVERLYQESARQDVTFTLTDLLLSLFCNRSALQGTFVILHTAFIAALYKIIGTDFGAEVVSKLVDRFESYYQEPSVTSGKEASNLISLLSHLYTFHVVSSNLVFDYVRLFLEGLSEVNTELLLRVVRDCGPQLRQDDPSSLKDIVRIMQHAAAHLTINGQEMSVRTKFMLETITDLKNNKIRAALNTSGVAIEHITSMRKVLGSLNNQNIRASEPLRIGRCDIRESDKKGKWWLVGASWKGNDTVDQSDQDARAIKDLTSGADGLTGEETDLLALARQYRMNTSVRRSIFISIMSATDFQDAHLRLLKLRLKRSQEREIPKVLLRCAAAETAYNPYYTLLTKRLCTEKRMKMDFQFVLWDFFKWMGESGDVEDSDEEDANPEVDLRGIVNLAKMYGHLVSEGSLTLAILKTLNLAYLKEKAKMFVELLFITVFLRVHDAANVDEDGDALRIVFGRVADTPQLCKGVEYFIKKVTAHSDLVMSEKERSIVKKSCRIVVDLLSLLAVDDSAVAL